MIDPIHITNFNRTVPELEELILFIVSAAGHNAHSSAKGVDKFIREGASNKTPFEIINLTSNLPERLKECGLGCYDLPN